MKKPSDITITDQFCGAGGSSIGATAAGARLHLALNHWQLAIETHNTNFPNAHHDCTEISACDPRKYPSTDILITSPECTNHTLAKGRPRKWQQQLDLFGKITIDPAEERSRATMWDVPRFAEYHQYNIIIVENVVEARMWAPWEGWLHAMRCLGYAHQCVYLNSMHVHPTPQSRDRMYVVFHRAGNKAPDLAITPLAHCHKCGIDAHAIQTWKNGKTFGKYRTQYVYRCPHCNTAVEPYYYAAANVIDWSLPIQRIADRARPLTPKTIERIEIGLKKFCAQPSASMQAANGDTSLTLDFRGDFAMRSVTEPLSVVVACATQHWLVNAPLILDTSYTHAKGNRAKRITDPMQTQTGQQSHALVVPPFVSSFYGNDAGHDLRDPMPTVMTHDKHALVVPFMVNMQGNSGPTQIHEPLNTLLTGYHKYLVQPQTPPSVESCGFRILQPHECGKAMAFPTDYRVLGTKREQVKQYGNAVTPPVMRELVSRCIASLN